MSIADKILKSLEESESVSGLQPFREMLKSGARLPSKEWLALCDLVKSKRVFAVLREDLTKREALMLGCALKRATLPHVNDIIDILLKKDDTNTPLLLAFILRKKKRIESGCIREYICGAINRSFEPRHLQLLEAMHINYPELINGPIVEFCRSYDHELCRMIVERKEAKREGHQ
jgi:hypothetical protein